MQSRDEFDGYKIECEVQRVGEYWVPRATFERNDSGRVIRFVKHLDSSEKYRTEADAWRAVAGIKVASVNDEGEVAFVRTTTGGDMVNNG